jgi:3-oxoacyl-[acyl-carrier-protein] synthase II
MNMALVTGMAWATPLGDSLDSVWDLMLSGKTGIAPVPHQARLRNNLAAQMRDPDPALPPAERLHQLACRTAKAALQSANRRPGDADILLILGTSLGTYLENRPDDSLYAWAQSVGRDLNLASPPIAVSTACSSGSDAILLGLELIRMGQARCCVCGGADVLTWSKRAGHSALGTMSPSHLRAFDVQHEGTLLGEGAGFLVLEADVPGENKKSLAILRGAGSANDATGMTAADVTGLAARYAIERSLADAELSAAAIGLINAHGSGTQMNDTTEKNALGAVFTAKPQPLVFATKGNFGHSLGATGALEAIALIMAMRTGRIPPIAGLENPDPEFPLPLAHPAAVSHRAQFGLSLTLGFGGFDTSLVFEVAQ